MELKALYFFTKMLGINFSSGGTELEQESITVEAWVYLAASNLDNLIFINGIMNHDIYLNILKENLK